MADQRECGMVSARSDWVPEGEIVRADPMASEGPGARRGINLVLIVV